MINRRTLIAASALATLPVYAQAVSIMEIMKPGALGDRVLGDEKAPVTMVEYASLTCGHCANFHNTTYPELKKKYIDTGKVKLIMREFPLNSLAAAGFMVARCAPPEQYYPIVDAYFKTQNVWTKAPNKMEALFSIASQAGYTRESFDACLANKTVLEGVQASQTQGEKLGVDATPTFFINGTKFSGALSIEELDKILAPLLK
jgi:protein-disulfide isomerase